MKLNKMNYISDINEILNTFTNAKYGMRLKKEDLYIKDNRLYVNQDGEIGVYSYPVNEYFESENTLWNITELPFKQFVDFVAAQGTIQ